MKLSLNTDPRDLLPPKKQQAHFAVGFFSLFPFIYIYTLALIETKYSIFLNLQPFRTGRPLTTAETALFVMVFSMEFLILLLGISTLFWRFYIKRISIGRQYAAWLIPITVLFIYFILVTTQFQVLRYFRDGVNIMLVRHLGGGDIWSALHYAASELTQLFPIIFTGVLVVVGSLFFLLRFGSRIISYFSEAGWITTWLQPKRLIVSNIVLFAGSFIISFYLPVLNKNLGYSLAHHVYVFPWEYITDFDLDGYGLVPRPIDHAPFNAKRHPYAIEILANGIDENGIGGDLTKNIWERTQLNTWKADHLKQRNVLLLVLESARADLYQAKYHGEWVMPTLRSLPGQKLNMITHTAFSALAIMSIFNGVHSRHESNPSLIDRFNQHGYRTGVFSAQNESFGKQDSVTGMSRAGTFFDSRSVTPDKRMHLSSSAIALNIPSHEVFLHFTAWLQTDSTQPFFAYVNLQEPHFPYSYKGIEKNLIDTPIPRYSINVEESDWLRATYYNAARVTDNFIADIVEFLKKNKLFENTVILIIGDHGEELFDFGSLGHGTIINYEQNSPIGKLINSSWVPDNDTPIGLSEVPKLIYNSLLKDAQDIIPLTGSAIAFLGIHTPQQIGIFTKEGLTKYDFRNSRWTRQPAYGFREEQSQPDMRLIHLWESYVLSISTQRQ